MLPPDGKENQPRKIDYLQQYCDYSDKAYERANSALPGLPGGDQVGGENNYDSVLSTDWHPFYDVRGVKYYHNFATGERMRQSPRRVPNTLDPGAELTKILDKDPPEKTLAETLTGFDSLQTEPSAVAAAAAQPVNRSMGPPYRTHLPNEVPADFN